MLAQLIDRLPFGWAGRLALQRLVSQWRSLLTIIAGTLLSAAVGALVPLYTTAVSQVSMVERLGQAPARDTQLSLSLALGAKTLASNQQSLNTVSAAYDDSIRNAVSTQLGQPFPGWVQQVIQFQETEPLDINPPPEVTENGEQRIPDPTLRVIVANYQQWAETVSVVAGRLPTEPPSAPEVDLELVIPFAAQQDLGLNIGEILTLDQGGPRGGWPTSRNIRAQIVGVVTLPEPLRSDQRAYFMEPSPLRVEAKSGGSGGYRATFAALATSAAVDRIATAFIPDVNLRVGWRVLFDHTRLPFSRSSEARQALFELQTNLAERYKQPTLNFTVYSKLVDFQLKGGGTVDQGLLVAYEQSVRSLDAPFGLLLLQVGALVIFFLIVTAALVRRGERREIAMLQSRGAQDLSIWLIRGLEALIICGGAALLAPVLAQQVLILITPFFAQYENLPLTLRPEDFAFAGAASIAAFVALMFTLRPVLRLPLTSAGGAALRSEKQAWWQRYYVDVILVLIGVVALWRLIGRDNALFTTNAGDRSTDPLLLLAPALLFLGLGSLLLRLFPTIASFAARLMSRQRGLVGSMAAWQLSREPIHYGRITFLLALAIGIGWFATSFRATVNRSQQDQARYRVGGDTRFDERNTLLNVNRARAIAAYTAIPGVAAAQVAWREGGINFQPNAQQPTLYGDLLGIESAGFAALPYWREDLGPIVTPRDPAQPIPLAQVGEALPFVPTRLGLWANFTVRGAFAGFVPDLDRLVRRTTINVRLQDATGTWIRAPFRLTEIEYDSTGAQQPGIGGGGSWAATGWGYFEADLSKLPQPIAAPVRLSSIYWLHRGRNTNGERDLQLTLAGLTGVTAQGERQPLDGLRSGAWSFAYDSGALSDGVIFPAFFDSRHGQGFTSRWNQAAAVSTVGVLLNYPMPSPLPAVVSSSLASRLSLSGSPKIEVRGIQGVTVSFAVKGSAQYFPTLYDSALQDGKWIDDAAHKPFLITDRDALLYALNRRPSAALYGDEVWLRAAAGIDPATILGAAKPQDQSASLLAVQTIAGELANLRTNPLSSGLLGLMLLAFIIAIALSIVGLLTYATLTAQSRRSEFGVLRAMGLPTNHLLAQLALEQIFVIGLGAGLGALLGAVLSSQVVPRLALALDAANRAITPPFIIQVEVSSLLQFGGIILLVLGLVLALSLILVRRLSVSRSLRLGDE